MANLFCMTDLDSTKPYSDTYPYKVSEISLQKVGSYSRPSLTKQNIGILAGNECSMKISDELQSLCYLVRKSCISVLHLLMFAINATNLLSKIKKTFEQYGTICKCKCSDQIESIRRCWPKKLKSANQMKIRGFCYFCIMYTICQGTIQLQNSWFLTVSITHSKSFVLFVHSCGLTLFVAGS